MNGGATLPTTTATTTDATDTTGAAETTVAAATTMPSDINTRYLVSLFNGNEFPIAIDKCNPVDVIGAGGYQMATCVSENEVQLAYFTADDPDCTASAYFATYYNSTYQTGQGSIFDFNCDASSEDAIATLKLGLTECESSSESDFVTLYAAVGVCTFSGLYDYLTTGTADFTSIYVNCDSSSAEIRTYDVSDATTVYIGDCDETNLLSVANATDECGYFMTMSSSYDVYAYVCLFFHSFFLY